MPSAQIYFTQEEDDKIQRLSNKWNLSKHDTIKRIVMEFKEKDGKKK